MEKLHNVILFLITLPIMAYYFISEYVELAVSVKQSYADKLFLKRIDIRPEEFDEFMAFKRQLIEKRNTPKVVWVKVVPELSRGMKIDVRDDEPSEFYPDGVK